MIWFYEDEVALRNREDSADTAEWAQVWAVPSAILFFCLVVIIVVGLWKLSLIERHKLLHLHDQPLQEEHAPEHQPLAETELVTQKAPM